MDDRIWISVELVTAIHSRQLAEHGGADGVRDLGLLESALGRPRHLFAYSDPTPEPPRLAAAYAFGIARNHAFVDGNKRTAAVVCETFLILNGYEFTATDAEAYPEFLALAAGELSEDAFAGWLTSHCRRT
jgi:death-on-curing protein